MGRGGQVSFVVWRFSRQRKEFNIPYGIDQQEWLTAIQEITHILSACAAITGQETISYHELFNQIKGLIHSAPPSGPDDYRFHRMLGGGALGVRPYLLTNKAGHAKVIHIIWQDLYVLNMIMVQYILPVVVMKRMVY